MQIWFDADNGPHILIMKPLAEELVRRGHEVFFTARDWANTPALLDLYEFPYQIAGGPYARGRAGKVVGNLARAASLVRAVRSRRPAVSFGHGSRALPIASRLLGIPTVTMYDYEWVNATLFNLGCRRILLPEVITKERCRAAGIAVDRVVYYPGYKEILYLGGGDLDNSIGVDLGLNSDRVHVLLRPPATTAHYHNPEAEIILEAILASLAARPEVQIVYLPRSRDQRDLPKRAGIRDTIIPQRVYDGPSLVAAMDLVISGGGTMTREAAIMRVPSYSFFRGRTGLVDESLVRSGRLTMLDNAEAVSKRLIVAKRLTTIRRPDPAPLVAFIVDIILEAASSPS